MPEIENTNQGFIFKDGYLYRTDENGEIAYDGTEATGPGVLTKEVPTGNMTIDKTQAKPYYTVGGYTSGNKYLGLKNRMTFKARRDYNKAVRSLIGKRNELTAFESYLGKGNLRRRDFKDEALLNDLSSRQYFVQDFDGHYSTDQQARIGDYTQKMDAAVLAGKTAKQQLLQRKINEYKTSKNNFNAERTVSALNNIIYPTLIGKRQKSAGRWDETRHDINVYRLRKNGDFCPTCDRTEGNRRFIWEPKTIGTYTTKQWIRPTKSKFVIRSSGPTENVEYGTKPEMTTVYSSPLQTTTEVETRQLETTPPEVQTSSQTVVTKKKSYSGTPRKTTNTSYKPKVVNKPIITNPTSSPTPSNPILQNQQRTNSYVIVDGQKVLLNQGEWTTVK